MKHLKKFEAVRHILKRHVAKKHHNGSLINDREDIDDIFVDLLEEYPELKFKLKYETLFKWTFINSEELGEYESKNYLYKMTDTLETIKGRL